MGFKTYAESGPLMWVRLRCTGKALPLLFFAFCFVFCLGGGEGGTSCRRQARSGGVYIGVVVAIRLVAEGCALGALGFHGPAVKKRKLVETTKVFGIVFCFSELKIRRLWQVV